jgi:hypothetical protein
MNKAFVIVLICVALFFILKLAIFFAISSAMKPKVDEDGNFIVPPASNQDDDDKDDFWKDDEDDFWEDDKKE